jgi:cyclohexanone monooxygenase
MVVEWISDCLGYLHQKHLTRIAATQQAESAWMEHSNELLVGSLLTEANSWFLGANIPGKKRAFLIYANTAPAYRQKCAEVAANGYEGFLLQ